MNKANGLHGRLVRVTRAEAGEIATYVVAQPDDDQAVATIRRLVARSQDRVEVVGRASDHLLLALELAAGDYKRVSGSE